MLRITALALTACFAYNPLVDANVFEDANERCLCSEPIVGRSGNSGACKDTIGKVNGQTDPYEEVTVDDDGDEECKNTCGADPNCQGYAWFPTLVENNCKLYDFVPLGTRRRNAAERKALCFAKNCACPSPPTTSPPTGAPPSAPDAIDSFQPKRYNVDDPDKGFALAGKCRLSGCDRNRVCRGPLINRGGATVDDAGGVNYQKGVEGCAQKCLDQGLEDDGSAVCESFNYIFNKPEGGNCLFYKGFPNSVLGTRPGSTRVDFTDYYCYTADLSPCVSFCNICPPGTGNLCPAECVDPDADPICTFGF